MRTIRLNKKSFFVLPVIVSSIFLINGCAAGLKEEFSSESIHGAGGSGGMPLGGGRHGGAAGRPGGGGMRPGMGGVNMLEPLNHTVMCLIYE